jgi:transposase
MKDTVELYQKLLNLPPPWKVSEVDLDPERLHVIVRVEWPEKQVHCPTCDALCGKHDRREERGWRHMDSVGYQTILLCRVPRADCGEHGVQSVKLPWAEAKSRFAAMFEAHAIDVLLATKCVKPAMGLLHLSWDEIHAVQERAVDRGLERRRLDDVEYVGIDEKSFGKGHDYVSVLCDLKNPRVIDVVHGRKEEHANQLWQTLSVEQRKNIKAVALDMWPAFIASTSKHVPGADLVHDKFHCAKHLNEAVDKVRRKENKELVSDGIESLKGSKYLWLKNPENWTPEQEATFKSLKADGLKVARAWAIKEMFSEFWNYIYPGAARNFFKRWYWWATHSRLKPIRYVARMLRDHLENLLTYMKHRITNAVAEGMNSKIQLIKSMARGFRNFQNYRVAILFYCGRLNLYPLKCL